MKKATLPILLCLMFPAYLLAQDLESIPADEARMWGVHLAELGDKIENPQVKIEANAAQANGFHVPDELGMLIVPQKDLQESEELAAKFKTPAGAALAYLFAYRVVPIVDGKRVDASRLRSVKMVDPDGAEHNVYVLLLAVRQLTDDDYRLWGYGKEKKPIIDARFSEGSTSRTGSVVIDARDADESTQEANVVVTVFGKYQARFRAGHVGD